MEIYFMIMEQQLLISYIWLFDEKAEGFYLFLCNEDFEVETDELYDSVEECMNVHIYGNNGHGDILWIAK